LISSVDASDVAVSDIDVVGSTRVLVPGVFTTPLEDFVVLVDDPDVTGITHGDVDGRTRDLFPLAVDTAIDFFVLVDTPESTISTNSDTSGRAIDLGPARAVPLVDFTSRVAEDDVVLVANGNVGSSTLDLRPRAR